ncbi:MutS-related protein [Mucilaginibacter aquaedulcis]|uniref:MutS-related protein n=1 Tax=Mucilaginibacter aquaedulcis TaxID=1187081 RepID=UPI0025B318EA|nr:DNA mismatch repair protein [Mucilaginibacter aquaedulcis]MDN3548839.1 DNA mismatch repair protein [Mucilaginibacter aquaedulcis]
MSQFADKQTLDDLNIPGRYKNNSIARLFDGTVTPGGTRLMDTMFRQPLLESADINKRSAIFRYFTGQAFVFPFHAEEFAVMEDYLHGGGGASLLLAAKDIAIKKILQIAAQDGTFDSFKDAVLQTVSMLKRCKDFILSIDREKTPYSDTLASFTAILTDDKLPIDLDGETNAREISVRKLIRYDHLLRGVLRDKMEKLMGLLYELDVYLAVAVVARRNGFCYAKALPKEENAMYINGLCHPCIKNATGNYVTFHADSNVTFLTGANMAGKSTLMKSAGIAVYLAHMGFPVAAKSMSFSVKDGLYSSINVPDDLGLGYSHFYAEVLRVKKIAEDVATGKTLFVIFDELFKGTNVKDAYDATLAISEAFSGKRDSFFIISTHITEVGKMLRERCGNFRFTYLPTIMNGSKPQYSYQLNEGVSEDRHGMTIIENEGILELIKEMPKSGNCPQ